jgi:hypothetical protein
MYEYSTQADKAVRIGRQGYVLYGVFKGSEYVYENLGRTNEGGRLCPPVRIRYGMVYSTNEGAL